MIKEKITVYSAIQPCKLGFMGLLTTQKGVCFLAFLDSPQDVKQAVELQFPNAVIQDANAQTQKCASDILELLDSPQKKHSIPFDIYGTDFQKKVWDALKKVPVGQTYTYTQLAQKIGQVKSVRAVANACGANKIAFLIPCHRIIRKDGSLSGYRWGVSRKKILLEQERAL